MLTFEHTKVFNFEGAFRGMRNPLDSWDKADSIFDAGFSNDGTILGSKDLDLAQRLIKGGSEHSKFMRQIFVSVDITAPLYWWSEADTYKVSTTANSCSTMHTLAKKPITLDIFEFEEEELVTERAYLNMVITHLENIRQKYKETNDYKWFRLLKKELPSSFKQKRTWTGNYAVVRNMYHQRDTHRLKEWTEDFCGWVQTLPYANELILF